MTPDVLIAGAGPAGALCATILARAGARVLLVDRARFPRDKLCGDSLNPGAMTILRRHNLAGPVEREGLPLEGMILTGERTAVTARYPRAQRGISIPRRLLDAQVLSAALDAGAEFGEAVTAEEAWLEESSRGSRVVGLTLRDVRGRRRQGAPVTILSDGRRSKVAFALGLAVHPRTPRRWAVGASFEGVDGLSAHGEMHVRAGRYLGVAPLRGGVANACLVTADTRVLHRPLDALVRAFAADRRLRERFEAARPVTPPTILGPLAVDVRAPGVAGLLLAGDAAGFIDPMTGDGLRFALRGAELAAGVALEMLASGDSNGWRTLARRRAAAFRRKWWFNRAVRSLVGHPAGVRVAGWAGACCPAALRQLVIVASDIPRDETRGGSRSRADHPAERPCV